MSSSFLQTDIQFLKGVGPQRAEILTKELRIFSIGDLLQLYPFRYVDRTKFYYIREINADMPYVQLRGKILRGETIGQGRSKRFVAYFTDGQDMMELIWFQGMRWQQNRYKSDIEYVVFGKPTEYKGKFNIAHPEIEPVSEENSKLSSALQSVYPSTEALKLKGLDSNGIRRIQAVLHSQISHNIPENLPEYFIRENNLISREEALKQVHFPTGKEELSKARYRLKFEELFYLQLKLLKQKTIRSAYTKG
ncbi:MAG: ATP-dependent DNA helicase RecG, partial [Bacteroidota bacterium]